MGSILMEQDGRQASFDVFDTSIVRRVAYPNDLHYLTARVLRREGLVTCSDRKWRDARLSAERSSRSLKVEPSLTDIYETLARTFSWSATQRAGARLLELQAELASAFPIASTLREYEALVSERRQPLFVSDTFFSSNEVSEILNHAGFFTKSKFVVASCEHETSKSEGGLYDIVLKSANINRQNLRHLGDNLKSDVLQAKSRGILAKLFKDSALSVCERMMYTATAGEATLEASIVSGAARAARHAKPVTVNDAIWNTATGVAGPVLTSFVLWTLLDAKKRGIKKVFFLARDGQVLTRLATRLSRWANVDVECTYLLASRQAFYIASLPDDPTSAISYALTHGQGRKVEDLLLELEFSQAAIARIIEETNISPDDKISPEYAERIKTYLVDSTELQQFACVQSERSGALTAYFKHKGFYSDSKTAIVDLGWQGNLQLRLDKIFAKSGTSKLFGYYYSLYTTPESLIDRVFTYTTPKELFNPHLLEIFCMADHKSVGGFSFDAEGAAVGLHANMLDDDAIAWGVRDQQQGIETYCRCLVDKLEFVDPIALATALRPAALATFTHFIRRPSVAEAHIYGSVLHASDQTHRDEREIAPLLSPFALIYLLVNPNLRRQTSKWAGGLISRATDVPLGRFARLCFTAPKRIIRARHQIIFSIRAIAQW